MERDRYRCIVKHLPFLPCSLYCNLRGEEGSGAERNRRFFLYDLSCSGFSTPPAASSSAAGRIRPSSTKVPPSCPYAPIHIRLHCPDRFHVFKKLLKGTADEGGIQGRLATDDSPEKDPVQDTSYSLLEDALEALSLEDKRESPAGSSQVVDIAMDSTLLLQTLLPTRHHILSDTDLLRTYLKEHVRGLMLRCRAFGDTTTSPQGPPRFAGEEAAVNGLLKSSLWWVVRPTALVACNTFRSSCPCFSCMVFSLFLLLSPFPLLFFLRLLDDALTFVIRLVAAFLWCLQSCCSCCSCCASSFEPVFLFHCCGSLCSSRCGSASCPSPGGCLLCYCLSRC